MIEFVNFDQEFLKKSFYWLTDPEIKMLTNTPDFTLEQQEEWFKSLKNKKDYIIFGIKYNNVPIGAAGIKNITNIDCEYWGYIGEKPYWGKGIGKVILTEMLNIAKNLHLKSVWLKVVKENNRAFNLYKNFGFEIEKEEQNVIFMRKFL